MRCVLTCLFIAALCVSFETFISILIVFHLTPLFTLQKHSTLANFVADSPIFQDLETETRLQNGLRANEYQFPYHAAIISDSNDDGERKLCSGSLIERRWVITSASCVLTSQSLRVRLGSVTHYTGGFLYEIHSRQDIIIHPFFNPESQENNLALIKLPIDPTSPGIASIELPPTGFNVTMQNNQVVTISGWGLTDAGDISPVLQFSYGSLLLNSDQRCLNNWDAATIQANRLCAKVFQASNGICAGESGSPLVINLHHRKLYLIGVAFLNPEEGLCKNSTSPYTNLAPFTQWIRDTVQKP